MIPVMITHSNGGTWFPALYEGDSDELEAELAGFKELKDTITVDICLIYKTYQERRVDIHSIFFWSFEKEDFLRWDSLNRKDE